MIEHHTFNVFSYHTFWKICLWYEKHAFGHLLKSLMLTYYNRCIKIFFMKHTFNARPGKRIFYKTPVLRTLFDVRIYELMNVR